MIFKSKLNNVVLFSFTIIFCEYFKMTSLMTLLNFRYYETTLVELRKD